VVQNIDRTKVIVVTWRTFVGAVMTNCCARWEEWTLPCCYGNECLEDKIFKKVSSSLKFYSSSRLLPFVKFTVYYIAKIFVSHFGMHYYCICR